MDRRTFLRAGGTGALALFAGCTGRGEQSTTSGGDGLADHPSGTGAADQPRLGEFGGHVIVAFEDPSCPRCRAFERQVLPAIRSNLVETGSTAFVARGYPVVYPWGRPACQALEATYARDTAAFWSLWGHYYETQSAFDGGNVLDRTAAFLNERTGVDGDAVVTDAADRAYDDAVQVDLDAGEAAGAGSTTPTLFLFRDGQFVTKAQGSVSYTVVATALGE